MANHIQSIISYLNDEQEMTGIDANKQDCHERATLANIEHGVTVARSAEPILSASQQSGELLIVGALYELSAGTVRLSHR